MGRLLACAAMAVALASCVSFDAASPPGQRWEYRGGKLKGDASTRPYEVGCNIAAVMDWPFLRSGRKCMENAGFRLVKEEN